MAPWVRWLWPKLSFAEGDVAQCNLVTRKRPRHADIHNLNHAHKPNDVGHLFAVNHLLSTVCMWAFLLMPLGLLLVRNYRPRLIPWWAIVLLVAGVGWAFYIGIVEFHFAGLGDEMRAYGDHPPDELSARWAHDTGRVFARYFGWAFALAYFSVCLVGYGLFQTWRRGQARAPVAER